MAVVRIPLVGSHYQRNVNLALDTVYQTKDQFFENTFFEKIVNPVTGRETAFLNKRPGLVSDLSFSNVGTSSCMEAAVWTGESGQGARRLSLWRDSADSNTLRVLRET